MDTIKDIADLFTQIAKSIEDRELVPLLFEIQSLVARLQSKNIALQEEKLDLKKVIFDLKKENQALTEKLNYKNINTIFHANLLWLPEVENPYCPVCFDDNNKLIRLFTSESNQTFYCPKCRKGGPITKHPYL
ncbi:MAG: hypothetical protein ACLQBQ_09605 [Smithella sp.]